MASAPTTKVEVAAQHLRERILSGDLAPGERLTVDQLRAELSMSPTPIREAFRILQSEGLIVYRPHQGMLVARQSIAEVEEIFQLRAVLESHAVQLATPQLDRETMAELGRLHTALFVANEQNNTAEYISLNRTWHWLIYRAAGGQLLEDFIQRLWAAFPWRIIGAFPGRAQEALKEHIPIQDAISVGDGQAAAEHMREHIIHGGEALVQRLRSLEQAR